MFCTLAAAPALLMGSTWALEYTESIGSEFTGPSEDTMMSAVTVRSYRAMTAGEIELAQEYFGDKIDYDQVKIVRHKLNIEGKGAYVIGGGSDMHTTPFSHCEDFSAADCDSYKKAVFLHEMTHIYQHQNNLDITMADYSGTIHFENGHTYYGDYDYAKDLPEKNDYMQFNNEQQAQMLMDYFYHCVSSDENGYSINPFAEVDHVGQTIEGQRSYECRADKDAGNTMARILHDHFNLQALPPTQDYVVTEINADGSWSAELKGKPSAKGKGLTS